MDPQTILSAVRDHSATLVTFEGGRKCVFAVNLKWKEGDNRYVTNFTPSTCGGKFYLDYMLSEGHGFKNDYDLYSRVVESGGPDHFDVNSDVIAVFECECASEFPSDGSDYMGLDEPEGLFGNYINTKGSTRYLGDEHVIVNTVFCNRNIEACVGYDFRDGFGARLMYCSPVDLKESIWRPCELSLSEVAFVVGCLPKGGYQSWPLASATQWPQDKRF
jgi:hypothetical protein